MLNNGRLAALEVGDTADDLIELSLDALLSALKTLQVAENKVDRVSGIRSG